TKPRSPILAGTSGVTMLVIQSMALEIGGVKKSAQASAAAGVVASALEVAARTTRATTPTPVAAIALIVRRAGGLEAGEAPWRRTAFRTRGFFPSPRERTRQSSAYQPAVEAGNHTAAPRDCLPPRGPRSEPTWSFRRISPAPARMRRRSGNWQSGPGK